MIDLLGQVGLALAEADAYDRFVSNGAEGQTFAFVETDTLFRVLEVELVQKLCRREMSVALQAMPKVLRALEREGLWDEDAKLLSSLGSFEELNAYLRGATPEAGENVAVPMMVFVYELHEALTEGSGFAPTTSALQ
jgi:hypothetical protein